MNKDRVISTCDKIMEYALYAIVFYLPISKAIIEICASLVIGAFLVKSIIRKKFIPHTFLDVPLLLYLLIAFFSVIFSSNIVISLRSFFFKLLENVLLLFAIADAVNTKKKIRNILIIFSISASLICIDGLFQFFTHIDFLRQRPWPYSPEPFTFRINASFLTANDLAAYLAPLLIIILGLTNIKFRHSFITSYINLLFISILICLFLTLTRGAWIGAFLGILLFSKFYWKKIVILLLALMVIFAATWQLLPENKKLELKDQLSFSNVGSYDRQLLAKLSLGMFKANPLIGAGLGTYMYNFDRFNVNKDYYRDGPRYAHNCYLQMLAEIGIFGLGVFLWIIVALFLKSMTILKKNSDYIYRSILIGLLGGLLAYLVHSAFDTNLYNLDIGMLFWLLLGLIQSQLKLSNQNSFH